MAAHASVSVRSASCWMYLGRRKLSQRQAIVYHWGPVDSQKKTENHAYPMCPRCFTDSMKLLSTGSGSWLVSLRHPNNGDGSAPAKSVSQWTKYRLKSRLVSFRSDLFCDVMAALIPRRTAPGGASACTNHPLLKASPLSTIRTDD